MSETDAYARAGVNVAAGDALVDRIKPYAARTKRPEVLGGLGGFGALFALGGRYRDPVLVSGTDGVGTKLLLASALGRHDTVGIDLVAMCVNDIAVTGAEPLFFLDYFATGRLDVDEAAEVIRGIAAGCEEAGCALVGGETAEMPGLYAPGHYDLAGFAVGVVERDQILDGSAIRPGHALVGLPSSGLHSNGFSLVRKILADAALPLDADPGTLGAPLGEVVMRPTRIYVRALQGLRARFPVHGLAHVTGGGLPGNVPRMLPEGLGVRLHRGSWPVPPIFTLLAEAGGLAQSDVDLAFNQGLGMVIATPPEAAAELADAAGGWVVGEVVSDPAGRAELV